MLHTINSLVQYVIVIFLAVQVFYLFFFSMLGKFRKKKSFAAAVTLRRIRILIPGYKEDSVIIDSALNALQHDYPEWLYEVVVIADSFSKTTLEALYKLPVKIVEVNFEKSTKGKAMQEAIGATAHDPAEIVVILDADNHMAPGFLHAVNNAFEQGYQVIQGHRTAKNFQTPMAFLDACIEEINNHIFRRGHRAAGLPSALIGSGMAFSWPLFVSLLKDIGDTSGEDKEIEFRIVRQRIPIAFLDSCYVYDEKVARNEIFSKQRSRWVATQLEFFEKYFLEGWVQLFKGNIAFFNKVFQTYLLPRALMVMAVAGWMLWVLFFAHQFFWVTTALVVALALSLLAGIPARWVGKELMLAFLQIPLAILSMLKAVLQIGKARRQFIHTPHGEAVQNNH